MKRFIRPRFLDELEPHRSWDDFPEESEPITKDSFCANSDLFCQTHFHSGSRDIPDGEYARQASFYKG